MAARGDICEENGEDDLSFPTPALTPATPRATTARTRTPTPPRQVCFQPIDDDIDIRLVPGGPEGRLTRYQTPHRAYNEVGPRLD